jgi:hypothetical protein
LVLAVLVTLSLGLVIHNGSTNFLPSISDAHATAVSITLTGCVINSAACTNTGWNGTTSNPNPTITVSQGDVLSIALSSGDGITHKFQLDVDNDGGESSDCGTTDPCSQSFPPNTTFMFTVMANPATYTYYCVFHTTVMHGSFIVSPGSTVGGVATSMINPGVVVQYVAIASILLAVIIATTLYQVRRRGQSTSTAETRPSP